MGTVKGKLLVVGLVRYVNFFNSMPAGNALFNNVMLLFVMVSDFPFLVERLSFSIE
jgi:hypothetical protein